MARWVTGLVGVVLGGGCGRVAFDSTSPDALGTPDARCELGPFSAPAKLPGPIATVSDDWFPTPNADETELYFYQFIGLMVTSDIVRATRATAADPFSSPTPVAELNSSDDESSLSLTADGLYLVMVRGAGGLTHLLETSRATTTQVWQQPIVIASLVDTVTNGVDIGPWLSPDGLRLTFGSSRGSGNYHLYESVRASRSDLWAAPVLLAETASTTTEDCPTESADGLELFFCSARGDIGGDDVYRATRPSVDLPFSTPQLVPELSTARDDIGLRLSLDGKRLYMNYDSVRTGGNADIWVATRDCL